MELLLITNRRKNNGSTKHHERLFVEEPRHEGTGTTEMARLNRKQKEYFVEPIPNTDSHLGHTANRVNVMLSFLNDCIAHGYDCVFYIHGYGKTFHQSIEQAVEIRNRYSNAAVMTFSWPSKEREGTVNFREKYINVQEVARACVPALAGILADLRQAVNLLPAGSKLSINLLIHSLGNYILEHLIRQNNPVDLTIFENIILNQADVEISTHVEWVRNVSPKNKIYITGNKGDVVLMASQILHQGAGPEDDRLGDSIHLHVIRSENALYVDFAKAKGITYEHQLFGLSAVDDNNYVRSFFELAFSGKYAIKAEAFHWNEALKCVQLLD